MDLIIKPTEKCNFKCTFCSSTMISDNHTDELPLKQIYQFLERFPETNTIIVNGGDPLMMKPDYYWPLFNWLDEHDYDTTVSFTTNLWPFYKNPKPWVDLFTHWRMGIHTSFQYGGGRLKGDYTEFTEEDFWKCSDAVLKYCGYRPEFIAVITKENIDRAIDNVLLAKEMNVECKLNYADASGEIKGQPFLMGDLYEVYLEIHERGLTPWEFNTKQLLDRLANKPTQCPQSRNCDEAIRVLQPSGDYYSCGAFGDDREKPIDFDWEMSGGFAYPLRNEPELQTMKQACYTCPLFDICNGCRKTIKDVKNAGLAEAHCRKMKDLAPRILEMGGLDPNKATPYVNEERDFIHV